MYRCDICNQTSKAGSPKLKHVIKRPDGNIAKEVPACSDCNHQLGRGLTLAQLRQRIQSRRAVAPAPTIFS